SRYASTSRSNSSCDLTPRPPSWRARAPLRPPLRAPPAPTGSRSPGPDPGSTPAPPACAPGVRASSRPASGNPRSSSDLLLARDPAQDAVDESPRVLGRIPLRQGHGLVDRDLERDAPEIQLVSRQPQDVALDGAEAVRRPALRRRGDPSVELLHPRGDGLGGFARERVHLALVERGERLPGHVPLVEEKERGSAGGAAT